MYVTIATSHNTVAKKSFMIKGFNTNRPEMTGLSWQVAITILNQTTVLYIQYVLYVSVDWKLLTHKSHFQMYRVDNALVTAW